MEQNGEPPQKILKVDSKIPEYMPWGILVVMSLAMVVDISTLASLERVDVAFKLVLPQLCMICYDNDGTNLNIYILRQMGLTSNAISYKRIITAIISFILNISYNTTLTYTHDGLMEKKKEKYGAFEYPVEHSSTGNVKIIFHIRQLGGDATKQQSQYLSKNECTNDSLAWTLTQKPNMHLGFKDTSKMSPILLEAENTIVIEYLKIEKPAGDAITFKKESDPFDSKNPSLHATHPEQLQDEDTKPVEASADGSLQSRQIVGQV